MAPKKRGIVIVLHGIILVAHHSPPNYIPIMMSSPYRTLWKQEFVVFWCYMFMFEIDILFNLLIKRLHAHHLCD